MTQTLALLLDAYRELNAKKLFWITLILSGLVMGAFAFLGVKGNAITFAGAHFDVSPMDPVIVYKMCFSFVVVGCWLTWAAVVLALISTAGIFPDLITGGTVDLYLSKPLSRLRLFLTKYLTGLLFVSLQVSAFATASYVVFGLRVGVWKPSLFLAVPLVVCMFSYLFGFCVLLGVWTRSTIAAILLTVIVWLLCWGAQKTDSVLLALEVVTQQQVNHARVMAQMNETARAKPAPTTTFSSDPNFPGNSPPAPEERLPDLEKTLARIQMIHRITTAVKTVVPKTTETTDMLDRHLFSEEEVSETQGGGRRRRNSNSQFGDDTSAKDAQTEVAGIVRNTSPWYIIGTSLLAEAVVVALAAWVFCRRDY